MLATAIGTIAYVQARTGDAAQKRVPQCRSGQLRLRAEEQPINSAMNGYTISVTTMERGLQCTVRGYPSVMLAPGRRGAVEIAMRPHLAGGGGPGHAVTVSSRAAKSGGFYVINWWSCEPRSGKVYGLVRFGLPAGDQIRGSTAMAFCSRSQAGLMVSPFTG
jgi:hypothetical protein